MLEIWNNFSKDMLGELCKMPPPHVAPPPTHQSIPEASGRPKNVTSGYHRQLEVTCFQGPAVIKDKWGTAQCLTCPRHSWWNWKLCFSCVQRVFWGLRRLHAASLDSRMPFKDLKWPHRFLGELRRHSLEGILKPREAVRSLLGPQKAKLSVFEEMARMLVAVT